MRTGTILFLLALVLNTLLGWNMALVIAITGIGVMVYTVFGGIQAVIWTDAIQGIILILGALICSLILLFSMPEGPGQLFQIAMDNKKFSLGSFSLELSSQTFWVTLIYGFFINLQNFGIDQNYIQRYMTSSSDKQAKNSTLYGGLLYIPVSILFFFIGTALFSYYQAIPDALPAVLKSGANSDKIFPYFIFNGLPVGVTGLLLSAIFAAGMSTVSSSVNSSATIILTDYFKKSIDPVKKEKRSLKILYVASILFGVLSTLVAIAMINVQSVLDVWWKLASIFSGGMLGLFMLGYFAKKINNASAIIGVISGVLVIGWISLSPFLLKSEKLIRFSSTFHPYLSIVLGTLTIFVVGFLIGILINKGRKKAN